MNGKDYKSFQDKNSVLINIYSFRRGFPGGRGVGRRDVGRLSLRHRFGREGQAGSRQGHAQL